MDTNKKICWFFDPLTRENMPLTTQVLAECERIDARVRYIRREITSPIPFMGFSGPTKIPIGEIPKIIAELETYKVRLGNILGDTDKKEQDHSL